MRGDMVTGYCGELAARTLTPCEEIRIGDAGRFQGRVGVYKWQVRALGSLDFCLYLSNLATACTVSACPLVRPCTPQPAR